ncbi:hypothetical protein D3C76_1282150 [compost metagenome]
MAEYRGTIANTAIHPISIYIKVESHLGQLNQIILKDIPRTAIVIIIANNTQPVTPFKAIKQMGVYEPAISTKIIE